MAAFSGSVFRSDFLSIQPLPSTIRLIIMEATVSPEEFRQVAMGRTASGPGARRGQLRHPDVYGHPDEENIQICQHTYTGRITHYGALTNKDLAQKLTISKEDIHLLKLYNLFVVL